MKFPNIIFNYYIYPVLTLAFSATSMDGVVTEGDQDEDKVNGNDGRAICG